MSSHAEKAEQYIHGVLSGEIPAGNLVRLACKRQVDDLARSWQYDYDSALGARVCRYIERLPHVKGKWGGRGELISLQPWQCFLVVTLFSWVHRETRKRRFRVVYWEIPRKNGKSTLAAGIGNYMFTSDGEYSAEVYCGATTEEQAWEVFRPARKMMEVSPEFAGMLGVSVMAKRMVVVHDESRFVPVIGKPGDGSSPNCAIIDEYHEHPTSDQYDTFETGMGAREHPLMMVITTAGANIAGPCYDKHYEAEQCLTGVRDIPELFCCIFGIDPPKNETEKGDDWTDPKILVKANPNFGISVDADFLRVQQRNAMESPPQQAKFKTKHLNVWAQVMAGAFDMEDFNACGDPYLDEEEFVGLTCWVSLDAASKLDLTASNRLYRKIMGSEVHYYLFSRYWLPEAEVNNSTENKKMYEKWVVSGDLIQTSGAELDFDLITDELKLECARINPREFVYDPFNAVQIAQNLREKNIKTVEFIQNAANFAVPLDEIKAAMKTRRFHHDSHPITRWCFSNVVGKVVKKGMIAPIKLKHHQKIDGAISALMCIARAAVPEKSGMDDFLNNPVIA